MKAYFDGKKMNVPEEWCGLFTNYKNTAIVTIGLIKVHLFFPDTPYLPNDRPVIPGANRLLRKARELGLPVIHTGLSAANGNAYNKKFPMNYTYVWHMSMGDLDMPPIPKDSMEGFAIETEASDFVIPGQAKLSPFYGTNLEILLRNQGIERVVLFGSMTDCCVLQAAFDASDRDFRVVVPGDLCAGTRHLQDKALNIMSLHCALVTDSGELINEWESQK